MSAAPAQVPLFAALPEPPVEYLQAYTCEDCGKLDTAGTYGPVWLEGEPGAYVCTSKNWYCKAHSAGRWLAHLVRRTQLAKRRELIARWKDGDRTYRLPVPSEDP